MAMKIHPGDEIWYRFASNKTHLLVEEAAQIKDNVWELSGRRITARGETHSKDLIDPFETSIHAHTIVKHVPGKFLQHDPETDMYITWNKLEEAYYVHYGHGVVGATDTLDEAWDLIARYAA